ncbi:DinB family protein [Flavihumibacter solisilvae]|uniref:DinB family protein n=1 Tax=Flavihumibacter solisilvae TaxID=1349421 RepID=UPI000689F416|nr:DinB family protein [Flavihumibacter solisilvae]
MKTLLQQYAAYHFWANQQLSIRILELDDSFAHKPLPSSFPSLHKTLLHMWSAETIWWKRLQKDLPARADTAPFETDTPALVKDLLELNEQWIDWLKDLPETAFEQQFSYTNLKGIAFEQPLYQVIHHLFNHGTYHRGQLVTMLRALEIDNIPQTDFVHWARGTNK